MDKKHPEIVMKPVESSQFTHVGHDAATNTLAIQFPPKKDGSVSVYHYANFTEQQLAEFLAAKSLGQYFGKHIKPAMDAHPFQKVA